MDFIYNMKITRSFCYKDPIELFAIYITIGLKRHSRFAQGGFRLVLEVK